MKRVFIIIYTAALTLLAGCGGNVFSSHRDMEHLRPIQAMGLDGAANGEITMSISTGIGPNGDAPLVMTGSASSIESAITELQNYSPEDELFYAHVRYILLGESLTFRGVTPVTEWVERSPSMRIDTPVFAVRGSAAEAVTASGEKTDITMLMASLEREELSRGQHVYTLLEVISALSERGCALCLAVDIKPSDGTVAVGSDMDISVIPASYAVLEGDVVRAYLTEEEAWGAELLEYGANGMQVEAAGNVLSLISGDAKADGQWDDGQLTGILINCELQAGVLDREEDGERDTRRLQDALSEAAESWLRAAVVRSQALSCDFLGLEAAVKNSAPGHVVPGQWSEIFPGLPVTVRVTGHIDKSYDVSGQ